MDRANVAIHPFDGPAAWRGPEVCDENDWLYRLGTGEIAELEGALAAVRARRLAVLDVRRATRRAS